ncbi:MAG: guanylate kinase [Phycisphaerales bacterium]|jgi:guanylate kinase|nr:guanylate kinase [Phycisphaerales bacterium]
MEDRATSQPGLLVIISGPSGVGKTTITHGVERAVPGAVFSVSCTTRTKTDADREGVDYFFISEARFDAMVREDRFLEHAEVFGRKYGTPREWVMDRLAEGKVVILEIDVEGARQVKEKVPHAFGVFVLPPSEDVLLNRLRHRKREDESQIQKRFAEAKREIARAKELSASHGVYDAFVTNDDLTRATREAVSLVEARRATTATRS